MVVKTKKPSISQIHSSLCCSHLLHHIHCINHNWWLHAFILPFPKGTTSPWLATICLAIIQCYNRLSKSHLRPDSRVPTAARTLLGSHDCVSATTWQQAHFYSRLQHSTVPWLIYNTFCKFLAFSSVFWPKKAHALRNTITPLTAAKKVVKLHLVTWLPQINHGRESTYGCKLRTTCIACCIGYSLATWSLAWYRIEIENRIE